MRSPRWLAMKTSASFAGCSRAAREPRQRSFVASFGISTEATGDGSIEEFPTFVCGKCTTFSHARSTDLSMRNVRTGKGRARREVTGAARDRRRDRPLAGSVGQPRDKYSVRRAWTCAFERPTGTAGSRAHVSSPDDLAALRVSALRTHSTRGGAKCPKTKRFYEGGAGFDSRRLHQFMRKNSYLRGCFFV